ncbi:MAG TPA: cache domain-containing protein, partial [Oculatellaceae cyanobacterium]
MTQISPKPNHRHNSNGRAAYPTGVPVEGLTSATNYSSSRQMPSYQEQKATEWSGPEEMGQIVATKGSRRQQRLGLKWFTASLRAKTLAVAIAISTLPVLGIGTFAYLTTNQGVEKDTFADLQINTQDLKDKLTFFLQFRYRDIQSFSTLEAFTDSTLKIPRQEKEQILDRLVQTYEVYDNIAVLDLKGNVLAQSLQKEALPNNANLFDRDYFQEVLKTNRPVVGNPQKSETSGLFSIYGAAPIKDKLTGKTIAIMRSRIPVKNLQVVFGPFEERGQDYFLIDSADNIFSSNVDNAVGKTLPQVFPLMTAQLKKVGRVDTYIHGQDQLTRINSLETFSPTQRLKEEFGLNWALLVATP